MAIEPPGVLQPMRCQVDRDRAALERISRRRQESRDLVSEGRDGTARVPGSDCGGKRNVDEYPDTPTIAPTTVSTTRPLRPDPRRWIPRLTAPGPNHLTKRSYRVQVIRAQCGRAVQAGVNRGARRAGLPTAPTSIRPSLPARCDQAILTFVSTNGHSVDIRNENWTSEMRTDKRAACRFSNRLSFRRALTCTSAACLTPVSSDIFLNFVSFFQMASNAGSTEVASIGRVTPFYSLVSSQ
jgi:hypothetical protein